MACSCVTPVSASASLHLPLFCLFQGQVSQCLGSTQITQGELICRSLVMSVEAFPKQGHMHRLSGVILSSEALDKHLGHYIEDVEGHLGKTMAPGPQVS